MPAHGIYQCFKISAINIFNNAKAQIFLRSILGKNTKIHLELFDRKGKVVFCRNCLFWKNLRRISFWRLSSLKNVLSELLVKAERIFSLN